VPDKILFIGTSFTSYTYEGVDEHLQGMAASASPRLRIEADSATMGATPLSGLWQNKSVQDKIQEGNWDVVVVQGRLSMGEDAASYEEYVRKFDELVRDIGARPVLFMNWQMDYEGSMGVFYPEIEEIAQVTARTGAEVNAEVAPVGLAWEQALAEDPDLELYDQDRKHSNAQGTYLTTAVFYATIFDRSPVGLPYGLEDVLPEHEAYDSYRAEYTIPDEEKAFLQRIAWETVQEYQAQQGVSR
jgi:hypothetical protein